eukprot:Seg331.2 transcript_id=Seg331.2/GoldUCD/mRNA.D3Y31 product="SNARE-associated protein Snapin" protein_id=Seg331.2/GoldUCD/D3Y31
MSANEDTASITSSKSGDLIENDLSNGILQILKPAVEEVDNRVLDVRKSQLDLREYIDKLTSDLQKLAELQKPPIDLDSYVKKLLNCRRRVVLVNSVLNNTHERLNKLQQNIVRETNKKRASLEAPSLP